MKLLLSALIVLSSAAALAMPAVGDDVTYSMTVTSGTSTITGTLEQTLTQTNTSGQFLEQSTSTVAGQQPQVQQSWVDATDLLNDQSVAQIMQGCASVGGTIQNVTVPAGTFSTCAVTSNDGTQATTYYIAAGVPFGLVQADITDSSGNHTVAVLSAFKAGN